MKTTITLFTLLFAVNVYAQTLTMADVKPPLGQRYVMHRANNQGALVPGNAGTGQVWDLSLATFDSEYDFTYQTMPASDAPGFTQFDNPSYAVRWYQGDSTLLNYEFKKDSAGFLFTMGEKQLLLFLRYPDPDLTLHLPLSLNDSLSDNYFYSSTVFSSSYYYSGTATLRFDGTGTLKLPYATITGVYRLHYTSRQIRESFNDTSYFTNYYWYKPGTPWPFAEYKSYTGSDQVTYTQVDMLDVPPPASVKGLESKGVLVYPNPAKDVLSVSVQQAEGPNSVWIYDLQGRQVGSYVFSGNSTELATGHLPAGVYCVRVANNGETITTRLVKQ